MRILLAIPGHLKTVPMNGYSAAALRALGHEVHVFDYHSRLGDRIAAQWAKLRATKEEKPGVNRRLRRLAQDLKPDLFFTIFGADISTESLAFMRERHITTACWWINDPFQFERSLKKARAYDVVFSNSAGSVAQYLAAGVAHAAFLPTACDPTIHKPVPAEERYRCDVCFAGDWSPLRERAMNLLAQRFDVRIFGPWRKKLAADSPLHAHLHDGFFSPAQMAAMFASARVVLNIHTWHETHDHGLNPRVFEAAGCGTVQVVDFKREIPTLFDCSNEIICYDSINDLPDVVAAALQRTDATTMRTAARVKAHTAHTYVHRMQQMLDVVGALAANKTNRNLQVPPRAHRSH